MAQLVHDASKEGLAEEELYIDVPFFGKGAIKSQQLVSSSFSLTLRPYLFHKSIIANAVDPVDCVFWRSSSSNSNCLISISDGRSE